MKYLCIFFLLFICLSVKAQISFVSNMGKPDYAAITILLDNQHNEKSQFYYTASNFPPSLISAVRDTSISDVKIISVHIGSDPRLYLMTIEGMNSITIYDDKFKLLRLFKNDSAFWFSQNASKKAPSIPYGTLLSVFKLFMFL